MTKRRYVAKKETKKVSSTNSAKSKGALTEEINYLTQYASDLNEYVNELEQDLVATFDTNEALQKVITRQEALIVGLENDVREHEAVLKIADVTIAVANEVGHVFVSRIAELEQDLHHMTMQRDAKVDRVKELETARSRVTVQVFELL